MWRKTWFLWRGGHSGGAAISCVQVAVFERRLGGGVRTRRPCVWEPCAPHFSYIVLFLLQTVNATKDAQPIVTRGQPEREGAGGGPGRRQAREERASLTWSCYRCFGYQTFPLFCFPVLHPLFSPVLSSSLFYQFCHLAPLKRIWLGRV